MMVSEATAFVAVVLLFLGGTSLALSLVAGVYSRRGKGRPVALLAVGVVSLVAMVYLLWDSSWGEAWSAVFYPVLHMSTAALAGLALGAFIVYLLVAGR